MRSQKQDAWGLLGVTLELLAVGALAAVAAAAIDFAAQYTLFVGQVMRLIAAEERWVGDPADAPLPSGSVVSGGAVLGWVGAVALALQLACIVVAALAARARPLAADARQQQSRASAFALSGAVVASILGMAVSAAVAVAAVQRAIDTLRAVARSSDPAAASARAADAMGGMVTLPLFGVLATASQLPLLAVVMTIAFATACGEAGRRHAGAFPPRRTVALTAARARAGSADHASQLGDPSSGRDLSGNLAADL